MGGGGGVSLSLSLSPVTGIFGKSEYWLYDIKNVLIVR